MTAPIGYPEQFGVLLRRDPPEGPTLGKPGLVPGFAPGYGPEVRPADANPIPPSDPGPHIEGPTFADHLKGFVSGIDQTQKSAEHKAEEFAVGHHNDIHGTMIAVEQAEISLHLLANVRNRVVDLYREVMRMGS